MRRNFAIAPVLALAASIPLASPTFASHRIVRADGSGDYPTLTAALQDAWANHPVDTILVAPGSYGEVVNIPEPLDCVIASTDGAAVTKIEGFTSIPENPNSYYYSSGVVSGITVEQPVAFGQDTRFVYWNHCVFEGGFHGLVPEGETPNFTACTFRDTSSFINYAYWMTDCSFEGAPAFFKNILGAIVMERCHFKGPAKALATVEPHDNSEIAFRDCTFSGAENGIVVNSKNYFDQAMWADFCQFHDLSGAAEFYEYGDWKQVELGYLFISLDHSSVRNVGQAIHAYAPIPIFMSCVGDTILNCAGVAIEASAQHAVLQNVQIDHAGGDGVHWILQLQDPGHYVPPTAYHQIWNCAISNCAGNGVTMLERPYSPIDFTEDLSVRNTTIHQSLNAGLWLESAAPTVTSCLLRGNGGDGIHLVLSGGAPTCSLGVNTLVDNGRDGLAIESAHQPTGIVAANNLLAGNQHFGFNMLASYLGDASRNDAWSNHGGDFAGLHAGESELGADPLLCAASAGDFELRADSPCAPGGVYGPIGAYGVGCAAIAAAGIPPPTRDFALSPNPARGSIAFSWPATEAPRGIEVLDVQGRVLWRSAPGGGAGGKLRWDGHDSQGKPLAAGVYLVRWDAAGRPPRSARFVWLGD